MDISRRKIIRKANSYLIAALAAGMVLSAVYLRRADEYTAPAEEETPARAAAARETRPIEDYGQIVRRNLFGLRVREETPAPQPRPRDPEPPRLNLRGTVLFSSGGGYAVIENPRAGKEEAVRVGGTIDGMDLVSVEWNRALLRGPAGEMLLTIDPEAAPPAPAAAPVPGRAPGRSGESFTVTRSRVDQAVANADEILRNLRIVPSDGGFRVSGIRPGSIADEFGLRDGDVVMSVNRTSLDRPENIMRVYNEVLERGFAAVEVTRDGQRVNLRYRIER